jgi:hypothetical protein
MLHIITPLFRFNLLPQVYSTIPKHNDIVWHIAVSSDRGHPNDTFITEDPRIIVYLVKCADNDIITKRNFVFKKIGEGYFYLLDDDTIFLEEVYHVYRSYQQKGFRGMILGNRLLRHNKKTRLQEAVFPSEDPEKTILDTGMVIASTDVLQHVEWQWTLPNVNYYRDYLFWSNCFRYFGPENVVHSHRVISFFNYYGHLLRVRKRIFGIEIKIDSNNLLFIWSYSLLVKAKRLVKRKNIN